MALYDCNYLLEHILHPWGTVVASVALPHVSMFRVTEMPATDFAWTLGEDPYRKLGGIRERRLVVSGRSGVETRLGKDREGKMLFDDEPTLYAEVRAFIADYLEQGKGSEYMHRLVFRALAEGDEYYVEPLSPDSNRDAKQTRFSWAYTFTFRAYRKADAQILTGPAAFFADLKNAAEAARKAVNSATAYVALANQTVKDTRSAFASFLQPIQAVGRMMQEVEDLAMSAGELIRLPGDFVKAAYTVLDQAGLAIEESLAAVPYSDRAELTRRFSDILGEIGESKRLVLEYTGLSTQLPIESGATTNVLGSTAGIQPATGTISSGLAIPHKVKAGETIEVIADTYGTTAAEIAMLNGMADYWTQPSGAPVGPGFVLLVPVPDGAPMPTAGPTDDEQVWQGSDVFGVGLLLEKGDLVWVDNDFAKLRGPDLLAQGIAMRCTTQLGDHGVFPGYGIIPLVGEGKTAESPARLASSAREQLMRDRRLKRVERLTVEDENGGYAVHATLTPRAGPQVDLAVPIGA